MFYTISAILSPDSFEEYSLSVSDSFSLSLAAAASVRCPHSSQAVFHGEKFSLAPGMRGVSQTPMATRAWKRRRLVCNIREVAHPNSDERQCR